MNDFLEEVARDDPAAFALFQEVLRPQLEESGPGVGEPLFKRIRAKSIYGLSDFGEIRWKGESHVHYRIYCSIENPRRLLAYHAVPKRWPVMTPHDKKICKTRFNDFHSASYNERERLKKS